MEHRFWPVLAGAGIFSFEHTSPDINGARTKALFDLTYDSPFRLGLAVFYSMPSAASDSKWSGVAGLKRLFGAKAFAKITKFEKKRVEEIIEKFARSGAIIAFQKDAYLGVKDSKSQESVVTQEGKWRVVEARCATGVRLFRLPPTRYMRAGWYLDFLSNFRGILASPCDD